MYAEFAAATGYRLAESNIAIISPCVYLANKAQALSFAVAESGENVEPMHPHMTKADNREVSLILNVSPRFGKSIVLYRTLRRCMVAGMKRDPLFAA